MVCHNLGYGAGNRNIRHEIATFKKMKYQIPRYCAAYCRTSTVIYVIGGEASGNAKLKTTYRYPKQLRHSIFGSGVCDKFMSCRFDRLTSTWTKLQDAPFELGIQVIKLGQYRPNKYN